MRYRFGIVLVGVFRVLLFIALFSACATSSIPGYHPKERTFRHAGGLILSLPEGWVPAPSFPAGVLFQADYPLSGPLKAHFRLQVEDHVPNLSEWKGLDGKRPDGRRMGALTGTYGRIVHIDARPISWSGQDGWEVLWTAQRDGFQVLVQRFSVVVALTGYHFYVEVPGARPDVLDAVSSSLAAQIRWNPPVREPSETVEAYRGYARLHTIEQRYPEAIRILHEALRLSPEDPSLYGMLAEAAREAGDYTTSVESYKEMIRLRPEEIEPYQGLAKTRLVQGNPQEAIPLLQKAAGLDPNDASLYEDLGNAFLAVDDPMKAQESFKKALRRDRNRAESYLGLARALRESGEPDLAVNRYRDALKIQPALHVAHCELYVLFEKQGFLSEAEKERKQCPDLPAPSSGRTPGVRNGASPPGSTP